MRFGEVLKTKVSEGKEKHIPVIELQKCAECGEDVVVTTVGKETPHPNTIEHHIKWIQLYGLKKDNQLLHLGTFGLGPAYTAPEVTAHLKTAELKTIFALAYCNIHGVWENSLEI